MRRPAVLLEDADLCGVDAGVSSYSRLDKISEADSRRIFDTNFWGVVNGSLIAAEHLRERPGGGAIINVGSILSDAPIPIQGVYSASKHAVKGFTNALRMELMRDEAPVTTTACCFRGLRAALVMKPPAGQGSGGVFWNGTETPLVPALASALTIRDTGAYLAALPHNHSFRGPP